MVSGRGMVRDIGYICALFGQWFSPFSFSCVLFCPCSVWVWHGLRADSQYYTVCQLVCAACGFSLVLFRAETIDSFAGSDGGGVKKLRLGFADRGMG